MVGNTGNGKTHLAAKLIQKNQYPKVLALAPTRNLAGGMGDRFEFPTEIEGFNPYRCAVPAESAYRTKGTDYQSLIVDEPDAQLPRILQGRLGTNTQDMNLRQFKILGKTVPHQFWLNANMSRVTLDAIEHLSGHRPTVVELVRPSQKSKVNVTVYHDTVVFNEKTGLPALLSGKYPAMRAIVAAALDKKKILVMTGGRENGKALQRRLRQHGIPARLRDGRYTFKETLKGFAKKPTADCNRHQVTICTRVAETGSDIQTEFDAVFVLLSPGQSSEQGYQIISRARALLDGRCDELHVHIPKQMNIGIEQLSPVYHLEKIKAQNRYYLALLAKLQSGNPEQVELVRQQVEALEAEFTLAARYKAEQHAQRYFCEKYLNRRFRALGWKIKDTFYGGEDAEADQRDRKQHKELLRKTEESTAFAIAKGRRRLSEYSAQRQEQIKDENDTGFVVQCYRRKLELARWFPQSPLEKPEWILENIIDDPRAEPQTKVLALMMMAHDPQIKALLDDYRKAIARSIVEVGTQYGPLTMLKMMGKKIELSALSVGAILAQSPFLLAAIAGAVQEWNKTTDGVKEAAELLRQNEQELAGFCRIYLDQDMSWSERSDVALVNKALSKLMGLKVNQTTQTRIQKKRVWSYGFAIQGAGDDEALDGRDWFTHWEMAGSAAFGWLQMMNTVLDMSVTLNSQTQEIIRRFSVTPPESLPEAAPVQAPPSELSDLIPGFASLPPDCQEDFEAMWVDEPTPERLEGIRSMVEGLLLIPA